MSGADSSMPALNADATAPQSAGSAVDELGISNQESQALLQLKVERAAMVREKERKGKIDSLRAEEERLKKAIADLDNKRS
jgi:polyhydroxyalkanoate synthesis regulator phasin